MAARCDGGAAGEGNQRHGPLTDMTALDSPDDYFMERKGWEEAAAALQSRKEKKKRKERRRRETGKIEEKKGRKRKRLY